MLASSLELMERILYFLQDPLPDVFQSAEWYCEMMVLSLKKGIKTKAKKIEYPLTLSVIHPVFSGEGFPISHSSSNIPTNTEEEDDRRELDR
ncbi:hypothetical protein NPIL_421471 [Nephila pilipes]|uniref:Uncharacterized protein n=1 Tax=Nephila pilipes TaxID=299642 RepID=A0A8X6PY43_NEPPI|nr:hypothetical protein NPIL_421471 [Nephila pilipes]